LQSSAKNISVYAVSPAVDTGSGSKMDVDDEEMDAAGNDGNEKETIKSSLARSALVRDRYHGLAVQFLTQMRLMALPDDSKSLSVNDLALVHSYRESRQTNIHTPCVNYVANRFGQRYKPSAQNSSSSSLPVRSASSTGSFGGGGITPGTTSGHSSAASSSGSALSRSSSLPTKSPGSIGSSFFKQQQQSVATKSIKADSEMDIDDEMEDSEHPRNVDITSASILAEKAMLAKKEERKTKAAISSDFGTVEVDEEIGGESENLLEKKKKEDVASPEKGAKKKKAAADGPAAPKPIKQVAVPKVAGRRVATFSEGPAIAEGATAKHTPPAVGEVIGGASSVFAKNPSGDDQQSHFTVNPYKVKQILVEKSYMNDRGYFVTENVWADDPEDLIRVQNYIKEHGPENPSDMPVESAVPSSTSNQMQLREQDDDESDQPVKSSSASSSIGQFLSTRKTAIVDDEEEEEEVDRKEAPDATVQAPASVANTPGPERKVKDEPAEGDEDDNLLSSLKPKPETAKKPIAQPTPHHPSALKHDHQPSTGKKQQSLNMFFSKK
jgi:hypothetical protein